MSPCGQGGNSHSVGTRSRTSFFFNNLSVLARSCGWAKLRCKGKGLAVMRTHRVRGAAARLSSAQHGDTRIQGSGVGSKGVCERGREGQLVEIDLPACQAGVCTTVPRASFRDPLHRDVL